jgi:transcription initiation factor IIE alpha subunit
MPISADRFENITGENSGPSPGTNAYEILSFLTQHTDKAFTQGEITEETGVTAGSVGPTLVRLRDRGRVDHRGKYWRLSDHVQSLDAALTNTATVAASHEDDPFEYDEWQEYAVDPREHRE